MYGAETAAQTLVLQLWKQWLLFDQPEEITHTCANGQTNLFDTGNHSQCGVSLHTGSKIVCHLVSNLTVQTMRDWSMAFCTVSGISGAMLTTSNVLGDSYYSTWSLKNAWQIYVSITSDQNKIGK